MSLSLSLSCRREASNECHRYDCWVLPVTVQYYDYIYQYGASIGVHRNICRVIIITYAIIRLCVG